MIFPWNRNKKPAIAASPTPDAVADMVREALTSVGASLVDIPRTDGEEIDPHTLFFSYKEGHFVAEILSSAPIVKIVMPNILQTSTSEFNEIRFCCNQLNIRETAAMATYIVRSEDPDEKEGEQHVDDDGSLKQVCVYLTSWLTVSETNVAVRDLMQLCDMLIADAYQMNSWFSSLMDQRSEENPFDFELNDATMKQKFAIVRSAEKRHYEERAAADMLTSAGELTIPGLLSAMFDIDPRAIIGAEMLGPDGYRQRLEPAALAATPVVAPIFAGEPSAGNMRQWLIVRVELTDSASAADNGMSGSRHPQSAVVSLRPYGSDATRAYVRLTAAIEGNDPMGGTDLSNPDVKPASATTLVAFNLRGNAGDDAEYRFMLDDARDKVASGHGERLSAEQRLLMRSFHSHSGFSLYHGTRHFMRGEFPQALIHLRNAYTDMLSHYHKMDDAAIEAFHDVCFMIGSCYQRFGRSDTAFYYLSLGVNHGHYLNDRAYIDALVNERAPHALDVVESTLQEMQNMMGQHPENITDEIRESVAYLKRRQSYLLIDRGRLSDAETILKSMLEADSNDEYALEQLAYIQKLRANG